MISSGGSARKLQSVTTRFTIRGTKVVAGCSYILVRCVKPPHSQMFDLSELWLLIHLTLDCIDDVQACKDFSFQGLIIPGSLVFQIIIGFLGFPCQKVLEVMPIAFFAIFPKPQRFQKLWACERLTHCLQVSAFVGNCWHAPFFVPPAADLQTPSLTPPSFWLPP